MPASSRRRLARTLLLCTSLALGASGCSDDDGGGDSDVAPDVASDAGDLGGDAGGDAPDVADVADVGDDTGPDAPLDVDASDGSDVDDASDTSADVDAGTELVIPDHYVHAVRTHGDAPLPDAPFRGDLTSYFRPGAGMPSAEVTALRRLQGVVLAGTSVGLLRWDSASDSFVTADPPVEGPITAIARRSTRIGGLDYVAVAHADGVTMWALADDEPTLEIGAPEGDIIALATDGDRVFVALEGGVYEALLPGDEHSLTPDPRTADVGVRGIDWLVGGELVVATDDGVLVFAPETDGPALVRFDDVPTSAVSTCQDGRVLVGSAAGLHILAADSTEGARIAEPGGFPAGDVVSVECRPDIWLVGHEVGATTVDPASSETNHFVSRRWLLADRVIGATAANDGSRWFATAEGITRIGAPEMTLAEKAASRHELLEQYFRRLDGFVSAEYVAPDQWTLDGGYQDDKDNDGLWTQMMIGAWAYAHAVTGEDGYCEAARRSITNMLLLIDIPCATFEAAGLECGFIARSFVRDDEGEVYDDKIERANWHPVEWSDGHTYRWKDDTSSDEIDGHTYGFPLYYDICATDEEQVAITEYFTDLTDYIIDNDYLLIDLDGEATTHGHWDPANISSCVDGFANCEETFEVCGSACFGGGYLNGMEILGTLLVAWHMSDDERYYREYERLLVEERYEEVITNVAQVLTLHEPAVENHSDHELMMLAYHSLLRYEPNAERRERWGAALLEMFETERVERHPLWIPFVAGLTGTVLDQAAAVESLQLYPLDLRKWRVDNSHRRDFVVNSSRDRFGDPQFVDVPPYDEIGYLWWNANPHEVVQGGNGRELQAPTHWLLAYWAMRYYGLLE